MSPLLYSRRDSELFGEYSKETRRALVVTRVSSPGG